MFTAGVHIRVQGLRVNPELNGRVGELVRPSEGSTGCGWIVRPFKHKEFPGGLKTLLLKSENCQPLSHVKVSGCPRKDAESTRVVMEMESNGMSHQNLDGFRHISEGVPGRK